MSKRYLLCLFLLFALPVGLTIPRSYAVEMPVFDWANYSQNSEILRQQIQATLNSFTMVQYQLQQLQYMVQNSMQLKQEISFTSISSIQRSLNSLSQLMQTARGIAMRFDQIQAAWDSVYPDFARYNGMSASDYARQNQILMQQTSNAIFDAMKAQGLVAQLGDDAANLNNLLAASANAGSLLAAVQAGNQIAGLGVLQLMRMQQIMAASYRAESSYYAQVVQNQAAGNAVKNKATGSQTINVPNPYDSPPAGEGFPGFPE